MFVPDRLKALLILLPLGLPPLALADATDWLARMRQAVHQLDYEGRFVYQVGDRLEGMYVVHRVRDGHELERLVALDGEPKQVIRGEQGVACLEPRSRRISVVGNRSGIVRDPTEDLDDIVSHYELRIDERPLRTAGRPTVLLEIRPRDRLRFGYRIELDRETALPLRSVLLEHDGRVRSQTLFVDLRTGRDVTPIEKDLSALALTRMPGRSVPAAHGDPVRWQFRGLPPGFRLITEDRSEGGGRHFVFTDGLASVSLYIERTGEALLQGFSRIGATGAYGTRRHGRQLIVVGEVPRETLRLIAEAVQPR